MTANHNNMALPVKIILFIIILFISWFLIDVLLLTFAAVLLAIFLRTLNNLIQRVIHLPDILSMSLVIAIILTVLMAMSIILTPIISEQIQNLSNDIPSALEEFKEILGSALNLDSISTLYQKLNIENLIPQGKTFLIQATNLFSTTFGLIGSVIFVMFMGIFFAFDPNTYKEGVISLIPPSNQKKTENTIESIGDILKWWIIGKMCSMIIIGIFTTLGLWFLGIPLAISLGLIAAILTFIPNIGPIIALIPAISVAFIQNPLSAFYVLALYVVIQTLESYIITPLIQGKIISLPPALIILSQLIMGLLTGFLGLALATPLLAAISVIIKKVYIEKNSKKNH